MCTVDFITCSVYGFSLLVTKMTQQSGRFCRKCTCFWSDSRGSGGLCSLQNQTANIGTTCSVLCRLDLTNNLPSVNFFCAAYSNCTAMPSFRIPLASSCWFCPNVEILDMFDSAGTVAFCYRKAWRFAGNSEAVYFVLSWIISFQTLDLYFQPFSRRYP